MGPLTEEVTCFRFFQICSGPRGSSSPSRRPPKSVRFEASEVVEPLQLNGVAELEVASSRQRGATSKSTSSPSTSVERRLDYDDPPTVERPQRGEWFLYLVVFVVTFLVQMLF